jgi:hypothetical protein
VARLLALYKKKGEATLAPMKIRWALGGGVFFVQSSMMMRERFPASCCPYSLQHLSESIQFA